MLVQRYDRGTLKPVRRLPDGRLICDAFISRSGVFTYILDDGTERREWRPPEEVFDPESLRSFQFVPVTDDHPSEMVTSANAKKLAVGSLGEKVDRVDDHVHSALTVFDENTVVKMENGKTELSCGYMVEVTLQSGKTDRGEKFDAVQRKIRGNHVAIVDQGRAGPTVAVRMDGAAVMKGDGMAAERDDQTKAFLQGIPARIFIEATSQEMSMEELKQKLSAALAQVADLELRADRAEKRATESDKARADVEAKLVKMEAERDDAIARADKSEKDRVDSIDQTKTQTRARIILEHKASELLGDIVKKEKLQIDTMSDRDLRLSVLTFVGKREIPKEKSDAYVEAAFDTFLENSDSSRRTVDEFESRLVDRRRERQVTSDDPEVQARNDRLRRDKDRWRQPMKPVNTGRGE